MSASNAYGGSTSGTLAVTEAADPITTTPFPIVFGLSNITTNYSLSNYFADNMGRPLFYWLSANPQASASLQGNSNLRIVGASRSAAYSVTVAASNAFGGTATDTMSITEMTDPISTTAFPAISGLGNNTVTYALSNFFIESVPGRTLYYWLSANPQASASISGCNVSITGAYRNATYNVTVAASNAFGGYATDTMSVTEPSDPISTTAFATVPPLSNTTVTYALSNYFTDSVPGRNLYYWLSANPQSNASISGNNMSIVGAYRNLAYNVTVAASNAFGGAATDTIAIVEAPASAYPVAALTGPTTTYSGRQYGNGVYIASASSSNDGCPPYSAFDYTTMSMWQCASGLYMTTSPFTYLGSQSTFDTKGGLSYPGEWVQIQLPYAIVPCTFIYRNSAVGSSFASTYPTTFYLFGSTDGSTWYLLYTRTGNTNANQTDGIILNASLTTYAYYRIVCPVSSGSAIGPAVGDLGLLGY